jgi:hypothetical protein
VKPLDDHRRLLFVLGMHRSGTSALCSALERCGVHFGADLLDPMAGVNEDGFWEDAAVVQVNQQLLERLGGTWFSLPTGIDQADWNSDVLADLQEVVRDILGRKSGPGPLQAVKDPRLCITLPFWLKACESLQLPTAVCVINRAPLGVARSLQKRDGFPIGYGLRLYSQYWHLLATNAPRETLYVSYESLLQDSAAVMRRLAESLPLTLPQSGLASSVKPELLHHSEQPGDPAQLVASNGAADLPALDQVIAQAYPVSALLSEFAQCLVRRGEQLTRLGDEHTNVQATLNQRGADLAGLSALHREALATIDERDAQIVEFDRRLAETGEHLSQALNTLRPRDELIQKIMSLPIIGSLLRAMKWVYEKR